MATTVDHDALFKLLLTAFFREFLLLFVPDLAVALEPSQLVFLDKESFSDLLDPDRREADLLVQVQVRHQAVTLLIHIEHQAQADKKLDRRMFRYFARFYDRYDAAIYPIALCSYARPKRPAADHHQLTVLRRQVLDFQYQVVQLNRLDWRDFLHTTNPAAIALMARMHIDAADRWRVKAACLRLLAGATLNGAQRRLIGQFVDIYLPLQPAEEEAFRVELATFAPTEQEIVMELVTSWERKARAEGQREGRREGRRVLVQDMLVHKYGALPDAVSAQLDTLSSRQLSRLAIALLDFTDIEELHRWLAKNPGQHRDALPETDS